MNDFDKYHQSILYLLMLLGKHKHRHSEYAIKHLKEFDSELADLLDILNDPECQFEFKGE